MQILFTRDQSPSFGVSWHLDYCFANTHCLHLLFSIRIELQARQYSCSKRQAIYTHLTGFLPCTKHTLLKRAKNLVLEDVDSKLKPAIRK